MEETGREGRMEREEKDAGKGRGAEGKGREQGREGHREGKGWEGKVTGKGRAEGRDGSREGRGTGCGREAKERWGHLLKKAPPTFLRRYPPPS